VFGVANPVAGATYTWSGNAGGTASGTGNSTCTVSGASYGEKQVSVFASEAAKGVTCRSADANEMKTTVVQVPGVPQGVTYSPTTLNCGTAMTLKIKDSSPNFGYDWYYGGQVENSRTLGSSVTNTWYSTAKAAYSVAAYCQLGELYCYGSYLNVPVEPSVLYNPMPTASSSCCPDAFYNGFCVYQNGESSYKPLYQQSVWTSCSELCQTIGGNVLLAVDAKWRSENITTDEYVWSNETNKGYKNGTSYTINEELVFGECMCFKW
jgi:hypothetical protein